LRAVYINYATAITPQHIGDAQYMFQPVVKDIQGKLLCIEPDYTDLIPPMQLRRMSRLLKMGIYAGMSCLRKAGVDRPDGIITGTGKGSMTDTEKFVKELDLYQEGALNPTPFILSTYNAVNGAIALQTQATGYNQTFVHRGSSLELSLYNAQLKLNRAQVTQHYLVGCFDEMTEEYFTIKHKIGYWKQDRDNATPLHIQCDSNGSIAGEGAAFFMVSNYPSRQQALAINSIHTFYQPRAEELPDIIDRQLNSRNLQKEDIGLLVLGMSGDRKDQEYYDQVMRHVGNDKPVLIFKDLCGEYETASGFGLWLTIQALQGIALPDQVWLNKKTIPAGSNILFYNHYRCIDHNLMLLS